MRAACKDGENSIAKKQSVIVVSGPTASGKSALAVDICAKLGGEVVNVDSVQLYRELDIGSAKPGLDERQAIPHHCFDLFWPSDYVDAELFAEYVLVKIRDIRARGKVAVLVGSPGMHLSFLFSDKHKLPKADPQLRAELNALPLEAVYAELKLVDPQRAAQLSPTDTARVVRALECFRLTGTPQSVWYAQPPLPAPCHGIMLVLDPDRNWLYERINSRSQAMVKAGLLEEAQALVAKYGRNIRPLGALGYKQALQCLAGELSVGQLAEQIALHTRHYAKRQVTFWRNEPVKKGWLQSVSLLKSAQSFVTSSWLAELSQTFESPRGFWRQSVALSGQPSTEIEHTQAFGSASVVWYLAVARKC